MRKLIISAFVSLDGVMQAPGGPEEDPTGGFQHGGWTVPYWDDSIGAQMGETFSAPFDLLLGRKTYDIFAAHWGNIVTDPNAPGYDAENAGIASLFNGVKKYVASRSPRTLSWQNSVSLGSDVAGELRELKRQEGPTLLVQGSADFIQRLLANDLVDEFRMLIYPVVLGNGKRLFGSGTLPRSFTLAKSVQTKPGVIAATYQRSGDVKIGSFALEKSSDAELERRRNLA